MHAEIRAYLDQIRSRLNLEPNTEHRVLSELFCYFQEKTVELEEQGYSETEAAREAIRSFGKAKTVARLSYEACSRGTWLEALISAQPHLIAAALFATHFWRRPLFLAAAFILLAGASALAWRRGQPNWRFSWTGYVLLPLLVAAYIARRLAEPALVFLLQGEGGLSSLWPLLPLAGLYSLCLWLLITVTRSAVRRDWQFASLMLLPLPIAGFWVVTIDRLNPLAERLGSELHRWDAAMAFIFVVLALTSVVFVRLRQRALKTVALLSIAALGAAHAVRSIWTDISLLGLAVVSLLVLGFLWSPALLKARPGIGSKDFALPIEELPEEPAR
jgi:hypothetical protein